MDYDFKFGEGEICKVAKEGLWYFYKDERVIIEMIDRGDSHQPYLIVSPENDKSEWVQEKYLSIVENSIKKLKES